MWIDEGAVERRAQAAVRSRPRNACRCGHRDRRRSWSSLVGAQRAARLEGRLSDAATAFAGERYPDARRILAPIVEEVPDLPEGRELYGLTLYRLGRWREAATASWTPSCD